MAMNESETSKQRHCTREYCTGNGIDVASGGDPVVPWAISLDLPVDEYCYYTGQPDPHNEKFQWRGYATDLPFKDETLDWVYSSHLLEDYLHWGPVLKEWVRVLKPGGNLIVLIPDMKLWNEAVKNGQPMNAAHRHEGKVGELSTYAENLNLEILEDRLTDSFPGDYSILFVARKKKVE